jgi:Mg/Co/Ni transporter MgtE
MTVIYSTDCHAHAACFGAIPLNHRAADYPTKTLNEPDLPKRYLFISVIGRRDAGGVFLNMVTEGMRDRIIIGWSQGRLSIAIAKSISDEIAELLEKSPNNVARIETPPLQGIAQ